MCMADGFGVRGSEKCAGIRCREDVDVEIAALERIAEDVVRSVVKEL